MTEIHVDFRESALITELRSKHPELSDSIKEVNLEIGDIHILHKDHGIHLVFERKTMSDLAASLKDGRWKEQKHRMLSVHNPKNITYVIEGSHIITNEAKYGLAPSVYDGMYVYTMYRDGVHLVHVRNITETAEWIAIVASKVQQHPEKFVEKEKEYVSSCKAKSRRIDNMTPENCFIMQLCQIPGISVKIAKTIKEAFPTMRELITSLSKSTNPTDTLAALPLIGKKKAHMIVSYLLV